MRVLYENPPLTEAVCEFRFEAGEPWDWAVPGRLYERLGGEFPRREHVPPMGNTPAAVPGGARLLPAPIRMRFLSSEGNAMVQVGCDLLAVNYLRPYPGWEAFSRTIYAALDAYESVARPAGLVRVGLRYINRIEVPVLEPATPVESSEYITASPGVPPRWQGEPLRGFVQRIEVPFPSVQAVLTVHSGSAEADRQDCVAFLVDLDFATDLTGVLPLGGAREWLEAAHREVFGAFQACITPRTEASFGRKENATT